MAIPDPSMSPPLPHAEAVVRGILTLPLHPHLSMAAVTRVCDSIRAFT